ncbi:hypothetical protein JCM17960_08300 [Magnetospira thiophila]
MRAIGYRFVSLRKFAEPFEREPSNPLGVHQWDVALTLETISCRQSKEKSTPPICSGPIRDRSFLTRRNPTEDDLWYLVVDDQGLGIPIYLTSECELGFGQDVHPPCTTTHPNLVQLSEAYVPPRVKQRLIPEPTSEPAWRYLSGNPAASNTVCLGQTRTPECWVENKLALQWLGQDILSDVVWENVQIPDFTLHEAFRAG